MAKRKSRLSEREQETLSHMAKIANRFSQRERDELRMKLLVLGLESLGTGNSRKYDACKYLLEKTKRASRKRK